MKKILITLLCMQGAVYCGKNDGAPSEHGSYISIDERTAYKIATKECEEIDDENKTVFSPFHLEVNKSYQLYGKIFIYRGEREIDHNINSKLPVHLFSRYLKGCSNEEQYFLAKRVGKIGFYVARKILKKSN